MLYMSPAAYIWTWDPGVRRHLSTLERTDISQGEGDSRKTGANGWVWDFRALISH